MTRRTASAGLLALALTVLAAPVTLAAAETTAPPRPDSVDLGGTPVEGGTAPGPTTITAGLWSDTLTGPGASEANTRWFRYERVMADSTVVIGAVATSPETFDQVRIAVSTPEGGDCAANDESPATQVPGSAYGALVSVGLDADGDDDTARCAAAPELRIAVSRGNVADVTSTLPYALRVVEEAPVRGERGAEPAEDVTLVTPERSSEPVATAGGDSFDDAPEIGDGTVGDVIPQGVERLWRVRLGWGQSLAVQVDLPRRPEPDDGEFVPEPTVVFTLFDPLRKSFEPGAVDADDDGPYSDDEATVLRDTTPPVSYLNRFDSPAIAYVPGDYWISVAVSPAGDDVEPVDVPVELTVEVSGEGEPPGFAEVVTGPGSTPGPNGYDQATPYLVADGVFSADVSGTPSGPDDEAAGADDSRRLAGLGVAAASLLSLLAGVVLLRRRARFSRPAAR